MAKLSKDLSAGMLHPRENLFVTGVLASANAEIVIPTDGVASISLDLRDTFSGTFQVQGTVDGTNWIVIPVRPIHTGGQYVANIIGTAQGQWGANISGFKSVRAIMLSFTSGSAIATLIGSNAPLNEDSTGSITPLLVTAVGAASATVTLTLPAPGANLRQYITSLRITRFASAVLTAAAAPVTITTTNIVGTPSISIPAEAAAQGTVYIYTEDYSSRPLMTTAQNTATTIVCPVATGVIWRVTAGYYVAP